MGVNALIGGPPMSRYAARSVTSSFLGPTFGLANSMFSVVGGITSGEFDETDTRALRRILPLQNVPYLRGMFDSVEQGVNSAMGLSN